MGCSATLRSIADTDALPQYRVQLNETRVPSLNGRPRIDTSVTLPPRLEEKPDAVLPPSVSGDDVIGDGGG